MEPVTECLDKPVSKNFSFKPLEFNHKRKGSVLRILIKSRRSRVHLFFNHLNSSQPFLSPAGDQACFSQVVSIRRDSLQP